MLREDRTAARNKLISLLLCFAMLFSMFPVSALAAQPGTVRYQLSETVCAELSEDGALTLSGEGDIGDCSPETPAPWYADRALITSVEIKEGITSLGGYLFYNCENLTGELTLPAGLIRIGESAFSGDSLEAAPKLRVIVNEFTSAELVTGAAPIPAQPNEPPVEAPANEGPANEGPASETPVEEAPPEDRAAPEPSSEEAPQLENPETPLSDTPGDPGVDPVIETVTGAEDAPADETTAPSEPIPEDPIVVPAEPETEVITEQILGEDIFFPGQSGLFYLAGTGNNSFRAAALKAGYTEVQDRADLKSPDETETARTQQTLNETVGDREITVSGELPEGAALSVEPVALDTASQMVTEHFGESSPSICFAYDITILVNGEKYQPADFGGSVRVTIGSVAVTEDFALLHFKADSTVETLSVQAEGDAAVFETDSFSLYIGVNRWVKLPGEIWYNGTNFFKNENCDTDTIINNADGLAFTDMQSIINHIDSDLTIYMKSGYTVSSTQSITGGTAYTVTLKRHSSYTESLITVSGTGNLTLSNIVIDGGAVWGGEVDATLGRGTTNSGIAALAALVAVKSGGTLLVDSGAVLQNNDNKAAPDSAMHTERGGAIHCLGTLTMTGGTIQNCAAASGGGISVYAAAGAATLNSGVLTGNHAAQNNQNGEGYGGGVCVVSGRLTVSGNVEISKNVCLGAGGAVFLNAAAGFTMAGGEVYGNASKSALGATNHGGAFGFYNTRAITISGGTIRDNNLNSDNKYGILTGQGGATIRITGGTVLDSVRLYADTGTGSSALNVEGGTVAAVSVEASTTAQVAITGGSVQSVTGVQPTNGGEMPANVYLNTIAMSGVTTETSVTALTSAASYGMNGVITDADGKIYVWLPESTKTTAATVADKSYTGTITSLNTNAAAATFYLEGTGPLTGSWSENYDTSWYFDVDGNELVDQLTFTLHDAADLAGLAQIVNGTGYPTDTDGAVVSDSARITADSFAGQTITLANDIALNNGELDENSRQWTPIGNVNCIFAGIFDGAGHTVSGLYIPDGHIQGLFGCIMSGTVQNLAVSGSVTCQYGYIGGVAGSVSGGEAKINNCSFTGSVSGNTYVGGIVGMVQENATVENCYSAGSVSGNTYVGSVAGIIYEGKGTVKYSYYLSGTASAAVGSGAATGCSSFGTDQHLNAAGYTAAGTPLLAALNGWVAANKTTYPDLQYWTVDENVNGGYPVLTDVAPITGNWADAGNYDSSWYNENDTHFTITTAAQLAGLAALVNAGNSFADKTITLGNDIALGGNGSAPQWTPIGTLTYQFMGTFEGAGYTVSNLAINSGALDNQGLFGYVGSSGVINNVNTAGVSRSTKTGANVGGVVGFNAGTVSDCSNSCTITGTENATQYFGGVAGTNTGTITRCGNTGTVTGKSTSGGIAGINGGTIENCWNHANIATQTNSAADCRSGGIAGTSFEGSIRNCYNTGNISGSTVSYSNNVGGIVGFVSSSSSATVLNCYSTGTITDSGSSTGVTKNLGGVVGYAKSGATVWYSHFLAGSASNAVGKNESASVSFCSSFAAGSSTLTPSTSYGTNLLTALNGWVKANKTAYPDLQYWTTEENVNGGYPTLTDVAPQYWTDEGSYDTSWYFGHESDTEYHLTTPEQLAGLAVIVNGDDNTNTGYYQTQTNSTVKVGGASLLTTANDMTGKTVYLDNDIALNSGTLTSASRQWTPIGTSYKRFSGVFDGGGHTIRGLYINTSSSDVGLFGYISTWNSTIKNIGVSGTISSTAGSVGGIVGYVSAGKVLNCYNACHISGNDSVGGIVGFTNGYVLNCYNTGAVTGTSSYIGGVTGQAGTNGRVQNCYNTGVVTGISSGTGGVVGLAYNGVVQHSYFLKAAGINSSLNAVGTNTSADVTSVGYFADSGGTLTPSNGTSLNAATYGTNLLTALNGWVDANIASYPGLEHWVTVSGVNGGYPMLTSAVPVKPTETKPVTLHACDELARTEDKPESVSIDLTELFGVDPQGKTISVTAVAASEGLTLDAFNTVHLQRRNAGYDTANTHFGVSAKLGSGTETDMYGLSGSTSLGTAATGATLTLKLYNYNALTQTRNAGTVTLTLSDGTSTQLVEITIARAAANISATVPLYVTAAVTATGDFIFPDGESYAIKNNSAFPIALTNVKWEWFGSEAAGETAASGVFALVNNARGMTPKLGFENGSTTYSFATGEGNSKEQAITTGQMLAHNGILPGTLPLRWDITLGEGCYFFDVWDGSAQIATITYTVAVVPDAVNT